MKTLKNLLRSSFSKDNNDSINKIKSKIVKDDIDEYSLKSELDISDNDIKEKDWMYIINSRKIVKYKLPLKESYFE